MSRVPLLATIHHIDDPLFPLNESTIIQAQQEFPLQRTPEYLHCVDNVWRHRQTKALYVPAPLRIPLIKWIHESAQHIGITKTYNTLRPLYYWLTMHRDIATFINSCSCQKFKSSSKQYGTLAGSIPLEKPFECVGIDFQGPFSFADADAPSYILSIIDHGTRWVELVLKLLRKTICERIQDFSLRQRDVP